MAQSKEERREAQRLASQANRRKKAEEEAKKAEEEEAKKAEEEAKKAEEEAKKAASNLFFKQNRARKKAAILALPTPDREEALRKEAESNLARVRKHRQLKMESKQPNGTSLLQLR